MSYWSLLYCWAVLLVATPKPLEGLTLVAGRYSGELTSLEKAGSSMLAGITLLGKGVGVAVIWHGVPGIPVPAAHGFINVTGPGPPGAPGNESSALKSPHARRW
jgi:hypothetical protein